MSDRRATSAVRLPMGTRLLMLARLLTVQASWNYEILLGTGIGFCVEPALRLLPGGRGGPAYRAAVARQSKYFNAHPYLASVAVGALARAELDGEAGARIERFRTALCGPLGSMGDRLVWVGWLPLCSLVALLTFGLDASPGVVLAVFLVLYNAGHLGLRLWGLNAGWSHGLAVAPALAGPVFRQGPAYLARAAAGLAGLAIPLAVHRVLEPGGALIWVTLLGAMIGAIAIVRIRHRAEGWRVALVVLALFLVVSVARHG